MASYKQSSHSRHPREKQTKKYVVQLSQTFTGFRRKSLKRLFWLFLSDIFWLLNASVFAWCFFSFVGVSVFDQWCRRYFFFVILNHNYYSLTLILISVPVWLTLPGLTIYYRRRDSGESARTPGRSRLGFVSVFIIVS